MGEHARSWVALVTLGAFHGINPAMGWLFAVALGLQEHRRAAVLRALLPLALGHALAIVAVIAIAILAGLTVPPHYIRWAGMRVGMADLTLWSFLVASVHGAGLMVLPIFLGMSAVHASADTSHMMSGTPAAAVAAVFLHASSYLLVTAAVALLVFEKLGVGVLRKAWLNVDLVWAAALMGTGAATLVM